MPLTPEVAAEVRGCLDAELAVACEDINAEQQMPPAMRQQLLAEHWRRFLAAIGVNVGEVRR